MQNNGTPGATSFDSIESKLPKYAFENTIYSDRPGVTGDNYWESERGFPQYIWMKFATPHRIAKLGFSSQSNAYAPTRFDIIGSSNCAAPWTVLRHVDDAGFTEWGQVKTWTVPLENRLAFTCIGLKIETSNRYDYPYIAVRQIQMWEWAGL